jgi:integrase
LLEAACQDSKIARGTTLPAFASWRLAELPRYLTADQVDRVIAACDGDSPQRRRDRAIILLLVRLGQRAGDLARLRIADVEWEAGTLRVSGKGRYQVRLPRPQDVGEAIIGYLECRPQVRDSDYIFVRNIAPVRAFVHGDGVSSEVRGVMKRAGLRPVRQRLARGECRASPRASRRAAASDKSREASRNRSRRAIEPLVPLPLLRRPRADHRDLERGSAPRYRPTAPTAAIRIDTS